MGGERIALGGRTWKSTWDAVTPRSEGPQWVVSGVRRETGKE